MYHYSSFDQDLVTNRVAQFRGQVARRLDGSLTEDEFKPLRLMNGLYLQLHAYMLRVAIPYGQGLRAFHHPPKHSIQLAQARRCARYFGGFS